MDLKLRAKSTTVLCSAERMIKNLINEDARQDVYSFVNDRHSGILQAQIPSFK